MAAIKATLIAITEMVRGRMEAVPLDAIMGQPKIKSVRHLINQLSTFASPFATTKWVVKHGFLRLVLMEARI